METTSKRRGINFTGFSDFDLKLTPEPGISSLVFAVFAGQR